MNKITVIITSVTSFLLVALAATIALLFLTATPVPVASDAAKTVASSAPGSADAFIGQALKNNPVPETTAKLALLSENPAELSRDKLRHKLDAKRDAFYGTNLVQPCKKNGQVGVRTAKTCTIPSDTKLSLNHRNIGLLPQFSGYTALREIYLQGDIPSLDQLLSYPNLTHLSLRAAKITDPSALSQLTSLKHLVLSRTDIPNLAFLTSLTQLESLKIYDLPVSEMPMLAALKGLETLEIAKLPHLDLTPLSDLETLTSLTIHDLETGDLGSIPELGTLTTLDLSHNAPFDTKPLSGLTKIRSLKMEGSGVTDVSFASKLHDLRHLRVANNPIADVSALAGMSKLVRLDLDDTDIFDTTMLPDVFWLTVPKRIR